MLVLCPACQARYNVPEAAIGPQGRQLQCAKCGHQWHINLPETTATPSTVTPAPLPATPASILPAAESEPDLPATVSPQEAPPLVDDTTPPADDPIQNLARLAALRRGPAWLPKPLQPYGQHFNTLNLLRAGLLALVAALVIVWFCTLRHHRTHQNTITYGQTASTNSTSLLAPPPAIPAQPTALLLSNLTLSIDKHAAPYRIAVGTPVGSAVDASPSSASPTVPSITTTPSATLALTVGGMLINSSTTVQQVPELRVQLLDATNQELDSWPATLADTTLSPGQSTRWQAVFPAPDFSRLKSYRAYFMPAPAASEASSSLPPDDNSSSNPSSSQP